MNFSRFTKIFIIFITGFVLAAIMSSVHSHFFQNIKIEKVLNSTVYTGVKDLNSAIVEIRSDINISRVDAVSKCADSVKYLGKENDIYFFKVVFDSDDLCDNVDLELFEYGKSIFAGEFQIEHETYSDTFEKYADLDDEGLSNLKKNFDKKNVALAFFEKGGEYKKSVRKTISHERMKSMLAYRQNIYERVAKGRQEKYISPIEGKPLPENNINKLPNAGRPYRADYTDGRHHGWDVGGAIGDEVIALSDGVIVRVKSDFDMQEFEKGIVRGEDLTDLDKMRNLDILRGNQVWLKTPKGDVVFYSHLDSIDESIDEGMFVEKGRVLGTLGITGIPDSDYTDYHVHFPIHFNPHDGADTDYTIEDYMAWPRRGQDKNGLKDIVEYQKQIFEY